MKNKMMTIAEAAERIEFGGVMVVAGSEAALARLPRGKWIGGTSVYFVLEDGGRMDLEQVFVTELDDATDARVTHFSREALPTLTRNRFDGGFASILIPAMSPSHQEFAINGARYPGLFDQPLVGWITGVHLDDLGTVTPKVFDGSTGQVHEDGAVLLNVAIPEDKVADVDIINLFTQDQTGDRIMFPETGFSARRAVVNGAEVDFAGYIRSKGIDTQLPLVANYAGMSVNVSFQTVDDTGVAFYAPVIAGAEYRIAKSPGAYAQVFAEKVIGDGSHEMSCNCILNYLYGELEGKKTGSFSGPATFGEIAYVLLNQTLVRTRVRAADTRASQVA